MHTTDKPAFNILMYSHDTYGLGHIRRCMAIASHLRNDDVNILILTGSPIAGRFAFPERVDFVRIPGMIKKTNEEYKPLSIKINFEEALNIRKSIILATAQTFEPDLFIVDKEPLGLKKEVLPTLEWLKDNSPKTKTILGLRDVMDDAQTVRQDWESKDVYQYLDELYSEIWVYGHQEIYDSISEYAIPAKIAEKIHFTGYIPRKTPSKKAARKIRDDFRIKPDERLVLVTAGGGGDGYEMVDTFLAILEAGSKLPPFRSILITGPFMPKPKRRSIAKRAKALNIRSMPFHSRLEEILGASDLVVSMGGYNTMCEILTQKKASIIVPRETPRREQIIRAQAFAKLGLLEYVPWADLSVDALEEKMQAVLETPAPYQKAAADFQLTGLDYMLKRLKEFRYG